MTPQARRRALGLCGGKAGPQVCNLGFQIRRPRPFKPQRTRKVGDLLVWDNRCSMHARDDFPSDQRRLMLRTTILGTKPPY